MKEDLTREKETKIQVGSILCLWYSIIIAAAIEGKGVRLNIVTQHWSKFGEWKSSQNKHVLFDH